MQHQFDMADDLFELDLFAEELPEQVMLLSDCLSSLASAGCGISSVGSIISCGKSKASAA